MPLLFYIVLFYSRYSSVSLSFGWFRCSFIALGVCKICWASRWLKSFRCVDCVCVAVQFIVGNFISYTSSFVKCRRNVSPRWAKCFSRWKRMVLCTVFFCFMTFYCVMSRGFQCVCPAIILEYTFSGSMPVLVIFVVGNRCALNIVYSNVCKSNVSVRARARSSLRPFAASSLQAQFQSFHSDSLEYNEKWKASYLMDKTPCTPWKGIYLLCCSKMWFFFNHLHWKHSLNKRKRKEPMIKTSIINPTTRQSQTDCNVHRNVAAVG